jgi:hypothetical protein
VAGDQDLGMDGGGVWGLSLWRVREVGFLVYFSPVESGIEGTERTVGCSRYYLTYITRALCVEVYKRLA